MESRITFLVLYPSGGRRGGARRGAADYPLGDAPYWRAGRASARKWLTAGFYFGRDQPNFIDTCCVGDVDNLCHIIEGQLWISLNEHDLFSAGLEDVVETAFQVF